MAGIKISNLPVVLTPQVTDIFPIVQSGVTYQAQAEYYFNLLNGLESVTYATTANLNATYNNGASGVGATLVNAGALAALSIDGNLVNVNDIILVKDQTLGAQNGVYIVTNTGSGIAAWVLTRTTTYNMPAQIGQGDIFTVLYGATEQYSQWIQIGQVLAIGTDPILFRSNIVAGTGISKVNNVLSATSIPGLSWQVVTANTITMVQDNGYLCNISNMTFAPLQLTLPASAAVGDTFWVVAMNTGGWQVKQNAGQQIQIASVTTTVGTGGSISSTSIGDAVIIVCNTANTGFSAFPITGNITYV